MTRIADRIADDLAGLINVAALRQRDAAEDRVNELEARLAHERQTRSIPTRQLGDLTDALDDERRDLATRLTRAIGYLAAINDADTLTEAHQIATNALRACRP